MCSKFRFVGTGILKSGGKMNLNVENCGPLKNLETAEFKELESKFSNGTSDSMNARFWTEGKFTAKLTANRKIEHILFTWQVFWNITVNRTFSFLSLILNLLFRYYRNPIFESNTKTELYTISHDCVIRRTLSPIFSWISDLFCPALTSSAK